MDPEPGTVRAGYPVEGVPPEGWWPALLGSGPPFRVVRSFQHVGQGPVLPIVDGLEGSGTAGYAGLPVVHTERKFQSHPAVPPGRLIEPLDMNVMILKVIKTI